MGGGKSKADSLALSESALRCDDRFYGFGVPQLIQNLPVLVVPQAGQTQPCAR